MRRAAAALALLALGAAALADDESYGAHPALLPVGGLVVFYNSRGPLSYESEQAGQRPSGARELGEIFARACQHGVSIPLSLSLRSISLSAAAGDGGYRKALDLMRKEHPTLAGVYDVKVDVRATTILGVYRRLCTEVAARGFALP